MRTILHTLSITAVILAAVIVIVFGVKPAFFKGWDLTNLPLSQLATCAQVQQFSLSDADVYLVNCDDQTWLLLPANSVQLVGPQLGNQYETLDGWCHMSFYFDGIRIIRYKEICDAHTFLGRPRRFGLRNFLLGIEAVIATKTNATGINIG